MIGKRSRKGLSTVVTTLIIILLVLAAIGIIWGPIKNLLTNSTNSLDQTKCLTFNVVATKAVNTSTTGAYNVTLKRSDAGDSAGDAVGAKLVFYSSSGNSPTIDFGTTLNPGDVKTSGFTSTQTGSFAGANRVDVTPYYVDSSGNNQLCTTTSTYTWTP